MTYRQYQMFAEIKHYPKSYDRALELNQLIFGSLCQRRWVIFDGQSFRVSSEGLSVWQKHNEWETHRSINNHKMSIRADKSIRVQKVTRKLSRIA
jgi:hypothetical protein